MFKHIFGGDGSDNRLEQLTGPFAAYNTFKDLPRAMRVAPDAMTWAGVQLWQRWLSPSSFALQAGDGSGGDDERVVCQARATTIWATMLSAYKSSDVLELLPDLEPELWELIFTFVEHVEAPTYH